jgi:myosin heavy subunit
MPPTSNQPNPSTNSANRSTSGRFAARGRSAASSSKSKSVSWADKKKKKELTGKVIAEKIKDGKLSHLAEHLESLPAQVSTVIEKFATSMLDLVLDIDLKSTPLARFGSMITKKDGEQVLYAPSCCRNDNPVTGSQLIKETDEYKTIVTDYDAILKTYREAATALLKKSAELEVSTREKLLRDKVIEAILEIALNLVVAECTRVKMAAPEAILLSKEVTAVIASKDYIAS